VNSMHDCCPDCHIPGDTWKDHVYSGVDDHKWAQLFQSLAGHVKGLSLDWHTAGVDTCQLPPHC
jgi:hypothetical protein